VLLEKNKKAKVKLALKKSQFKDNRKNIESLQNQDLDQRKILNNPPEAKRILMLLKSKNNKRKN